MKAVILAAGEGIRLLPVTETRPKHLIKLCGKPILQFCLEAVKNAGLTEVLIVTHYMGEKIRDYFGDGETLGLKISYAEQEKILGTGNATNVSESYVEDDFVLIYGDLLFGPDTVKKVIQAYHHGKTSAVMGVIQVDKPENYGIIEFAEQKKVKRIVEKPLAEKAPSNLANAGIYVFSREIFAKIKQTKKSIRGEVELTDAVTFLLKRAKQF
jgi:dTDP-glucose pyrophosphorylase